ncbi:hypothetical protein Taro_026257 [Colocasia esculenta]|uniref:Uncharacterized protein n=1 Tax=Colocasia esculenta TaxID=4460 RepID=A0A843VJ22_COLES|nr:hypothetical protein [Colocasia esculenta]
MDGDMGVRRLLSSMSLKPGRPSPSPSLSRLSFPPLFFSPSRSFSAVLGCLPCVEAVVLRRVSLRSCRGRVRAVRCEEETFLPTRRPQRVPGESAPGTPVWPEGDIGPVATLPDWMRQGLCRIEKATGPMSPSQSRGRLFFRSFRFRLTVPVAPVLVPWYGLTLVVRPVCGT